MHFHIFLYMLLTVFILPLEIITWNIAMEYSAAEMAFLSRRALMSPLFDLSRGFLCFTAVFGLLAVADGFRIMFKKQAACEKIHPYCGFFLLICSLSALLKQPLGVALAIPLTLVGTVLVYSSVLRTSKSSFLAPRQTQRTSLPDRLEAFFCILPLLTGALLLFQEGFLHWLAFPHSRFFIFLPFLGCLIAKRQRLREFILFSYGGFTVLSLAFALTMIFIDGSMLADISIIAAFIFLETEAVFLLRGFLGGRKNLSVFTLLLTVPMAKYLMPPLCSCWVVALSVFLLYVLMENLTLIRKKILSRAESGSGNVRFITRSEYAAQSWGFAAVLMAYLTGPMSFLSILITIAAVLVVALLRRRIGSKHLWMECCAVIGVAFAVPMPGVRPLVLLAAFAGALPMMTAIWQTGALINKFGKERPLQKFYLALTNAVVFIVLSVLFFFHTPDTLIIALYFLLSGLIRLGECAYERTSRHLKLFTACIFIILGQIIAIIPGTPVPRPFWSVNAVYCGIFAFFALYFYHTFDRTPERMPGHG